MRKGGLNLKSNLVPALTKQGMSGTTKRAVRLRALAGNGLRADWLRSSAPPPNQLPGMIERCSHFLAGALEVAEAVRDYVER
jgi:hypothetical protein